MKLAVIINKKMFSGKLCKIFTGCYAYHTCWIDLERNLVYDQGFLFQRRRWPKEKWHDSDIWMFEIPEITNEYLESKLTDDNSKYGFRDYLLFGFRWFYKLVGRQVPNVNGKICSETQNEDLILHGYRTPWGVYQEPPSPCQLLHWLTKTLPEDRLTIIKAIK